MIGNFELWSLEINNILGSLIHLCFYKRWTTWVMATPAQTEVRRNKFAFYPWYCSPGGEHYVDSTAELPPLAGWIRIRGVQPVPRSGRN